jgi:hypothetical protein
MCERVQIDRDASERHRIEDRSDRAKGPRRPISPYPTDNIGAAMDIVGHPAGDPVYFSSRGVRFFRFIENLADEKGNRAGECKRRGCGICQYASSHNGHSER